MKHATTILAAILSALLPACGNDDSGASPSPPPASQSSSPSPPSVPRRHVGTGFAAR